MNREIKFRAWDGERMHTEYFTLNSDGSIASTSVSRLTLTCKLMQYTGLKDKSDKDIYEGDILKLILHYPREHQDKHPGDRFGVLQGPVSWIDGWLYINSDGEGGTSNNLLYKEVAKNFVVVGNIYENPELLK